MTAVYEKRKGYIMAKAKKDIKKVVLAYSGGLDTSSRFPPTWVRARSLTVWKKRH